MDRLGGNFGSQDFPDEGDYDLDDDRFAAEPPPSPVGQDERRMQVRAYNHWASLLGDRNYPSIEDLEPDNLDDFGPHSVLLDFSVGADDPAIQYLGRELADECGAMEEIERLSDIPARSLLSRITDHYMQIIANQAPIGFEAEFINQRGSTVLYRGILLPYSSDNDTIDFIYGVINWKELADQATADELLLEIDQALKDTQGDEHTADTADILELGGDMHEDSPPPSDELPMPAFGAQDDEEAADIGDEPSERVSAWKFGLGYSDEDGEPVDYSLPDFDEEEAEDVDEVIDPLADETAGFGLSSLVTRGEKPRPTLDMSSAMDEHELSGSSEHGYAVPQAYEPEVPPVHIEIAPVTREAQSAAASTAQEAEDAREAVDEAEDHAQDTLPPSQSEPQGLYDCLAAARELAHVARSREDRSRKALYEAVGRAYDFSLEAAEDPDGFAELVADAGLKMQDRAPMTPVVKLVFGADYDKTRLTEYATVLGHAHRTGVERGGLCDYLRQAEGGLKGVVETERRLRREEQGETAERPAAIKPAMADKLRQLEQLDIDDIADDGPEFALVMIRRLPDGGIAVIGELPEDIKGLEKAGRTILSGY